MSTMVEAPEAPPAPAGPADAGELALPAPPLVEQSRVRTTLQLSVRQLGFVFRARRQLGETFRFHGYANERPEAIISHPDHVRSLFTADPADAPSVAATSPLRPVVGPNSVLTALGPRHMRQRKLLLPAFHGEAVARYREMIAQAADREIDSWPLGRPFALAPRMQAITLDVIMCWIFGIEGRPQRGTPEHGLRRAVSTVLALSTIRITKIAELSNMGK